MSRIHKLENIYKEQLEDKDIQNISKFIQSVIDADITKGKYARFLIEAFLNDKFLEEDLIGGLNSTVGQAISLFDKHKSKLPVNERSVYALNQNTGKALYQSPGDLWNNVKQYQGELSGKELKREEQEQVYRETEFVYKDEETGFQIVSPLTKASAKWWGKGTRWCTSADNNNQFDYYAKQAPLLILLMPNSSDNAGNGDKLQYWKNGNDIQFMDEADNEIELEYIEQNWKILKKFIIWINDFNFIPDKYINYDFCYYLVNKNGENFRYIPKEFKTKELCDIVIKQKKLFLGYVPEDLRTEELCKLTVQQNGMSLEFVPKEYKTKELCELAIKNNGMAIMFVPDEYKTDEMYLKAIQSNGYILYYIPEHLKTKEVCINAVHNNEWSITAVPKQWQTEELYKMAIHKNEQIIPLIPPHMFSSFEICELVIQCDKENNKERKSFFGYIPEEYKTKELYQLAVKSNGEALEYIPEEFRTQELCELAVQSNGMALLHVPEKFKTFKICKMAAEQDELSVLFLEGKIREEIEQYLESKTIVIPKEKYEKTFNEIRSTFCKLPSLMTTVNLK